MSDVTGPSGHICQTPSTPDNDRFNDEIPYETRGRYPNMGIDTPSDDFYNIHTTQYVPPVSARHKLQPRLPKPNQSPETFPNKQTKQRWTGPIYLPAHIYKLMSQEVKDALQKYNAEAIQKLSPQEIYMKLFFYKIYMKIHKKILQHSIKMINLQITKNPILIKI